MEEKTLIHELTKALPNDPKLAIVHFARNVKALIASKNALQSIPKADTFAIMSFYEKFITKFSIDIGVTAETFEGNKKYDSVMLEAVTKSIILSEPKLFESKTKLEIDEIIGRYISNIDEDSFGFAKLNSQEKNKIHEHISRIRLLIEASDLPDRKKNALFERLSSLAGEVDQYGTRTDQFFAFMGDVAFVMGDMTKKAKPLIDEVKDMMKILSRSRARQEGVSLPPGDETVLLPPPEDGEI